MSKDDRLTGEVSQLLKTVYEHFEKEDRATRERQIRHWRRLKLYWNNFSQIYWSETAHDYRIYGRDAQSSESDQDYYDRPVNVFRAFLETLIAALSIQIPAINCVPDDADNPNDISTAKSGNIIAMQLYKHNNVVYLWLNALYIYCTEGLIACYTYVDEDKKYGTYEHKNYKNEEVEARVCPNCEQRLGDEVFSNTIEDMFDPGEDEVKIDAEIDKAGPICPECGFELDPKLEKTKLIIPRFTGTTTKPKSRICMEVRGGLYVKVANYAKDQQGTPYLIYSYETHYANAMECYPDIRDQVPQGGWSNIGENDPYEQLGRLNTQYRGEFPEENVTVKNIWLRPAAFNILPDEDCKRLKKLFPDGVRVVFINNLCAEYENECLDDHWTLTQNPLSDFLNHEPAGELLTNIQDITNDLISLTLQTIEHGIAQTWVDPAVVNLDGQRQTEAMPGTLTAVKQISANKNISEAFFTSKTATLSPEIFQFYRIIQELGQFVSGAVPALFGGQQTQGSKTAAEYSQSKASALQRLQTPWKMLNVWWKQIFAKAIPQYMEIMVEDERLVQKDDRENYVNVYIRKSELQGKIGEVELDPDEQMPITDEEQAAIILQLMTLNNQEITGALLDPENIPFIKKIIKIPQFKVPGEDDRQKQYEEINLMVNQQPIIGQPTEQEMADATASGQPLQPTEEPSVEIDVDVDNHAIEGSICRTWLVSEAGRLAKVENPEGYKNILLHMKKHMMVIQQQMLQQQMDQMSAPQSGMPEQQKPNSATPAEKT